MLAHLYSSQILLNIGGEHGQDQDWISYRTLAIFLDQDWIWIFILKKKWIRTGSGYWFDFHNEIFPRVILEMARAANGPDFGRAAEVERAGR